MKLNKKIITTLLIASTIAFVGCGGGGGGTAPSSNLSVQAADVQAAIDGPKYDLTQELKDALAHMGNEERLAYDVYNYFDNRFGTRQFENIATRSEYEHISAVQALVQKYDLSDSDFTNVDLTPNGYKNTPIENMTPGKYDISTIQELYNNLIAYGNDSEIDALQVGCMVEVTDVNDLNEYIALAQNSNAPDVVTVFEYLRAGSYNHYWGFDNGLKSRGVSDGCCSLGSDYCKSETEYPRSNGGSGGNRGYHGGR